MLKGKGVKTINIVLYQPEIPFNTGNIARTCVITNSTLHLIKPLGFSINEKAIKRAGLDYWEHLDLKIYDDFNDFMNKNNKPELFLMTTHGTQNYSEIQYTKDAFIIFGRESAGLPNVIHELFPKNRFRIPMANSPQARSLNLSNSVSIVLFEALRQNGFENLV